MAPGGTPRPVRAGQRGTVTASPRGPAGSATTWTSGFLRLPGTRSGPPSAGAYDEDGPVTRGAPGSRPHRFSGFRPSENVDGCRAAVRLGSRPGSCGRRFAAEETDRSPASTPRRPGGGRPRPRSSVATPDGLMAHFAMQ